MRTQLEVLLEKMDANMATSANSIVGGHGMNQPKERVTSAQIIVTGSRKKPYYEIEYVTLDGETHIGYSSYCLDFVFDYLETCFEHCDGAMKAEGGDHAAD